jgi:site-specific recombinase XerD
MAIKRLYLSVRNALRTGGRYTSLSGLRTIQGCSDDVYPLIVIDQAGRPVPHVTEWYRLSRLNTGPATTRATRLGLLLPAFSFLLDCHWEWNASPLLLRKHLMIFFNEALSCILSPDSSIDGYYVKPGKDTPLTYSSLRGVCAALRNFYDVMRKAGYYPYSNPMESDFLRELRPLRIESEQAVHALEVSGQLPSTFGRRASAFFHVDKKGDWAPDERLSLPDFINGLGDAIEKMLADSRLSYRDKSIIGLLRYTGARVSEIVGMTVGGYRSFKHDGIVGRAMIRNKRSNGVEDKRIYFDEAIEVQKWLLRYLRYERVHWDPNHIKRLSELPPDAPFFLTQHHTPYSYDSFKWQWRRVYADARQLCPMDFSPHDLRHLLVTEWLILAREELDTESSDYADHKRAFSDLMGWSNPTTIELYDHSVNKVQALGKLFELQRRIRQRGMHLKLTKKATATKSHDEDEEQDVLTHESDIEQDTRLPSSSSASWFKARVRQER